MLIRRRFIYLFVLPHNCDQFFIHDCFELHYDNFQEYPGPRGIVPSRNIHERVPFKWLKAIYGKIRTKNQCRCVKVSLPDAIVVRMYLYVRIKDAPWERSYLML